MKKMTKFYILNQKQLIMEKTMDEKEKTFKRIKEKILSNIEVSNRDFEFAKLNANLFKDIKFIKKRKAKKKWLTRKLTEKTKR